MTNKEWQDLGATHEDDLLYKAQEIRVEYKRLTEVCAVSRGGDTTCFGHAESEGISRCSARECAYARRPGVPQAGCGARIAYASRLRLRQAFSRML